MKDKKFFILLVIILVIALYATNPTKNDFIDYFKNDITDNLRSQGLTSMNFVDELLLVLAGKSASSVADIIYKRKDYYLFSIYSVNSVNFNHAYLGIFDKFFEIRNELNIKGINEMFQERINLVDKNIRIKEDEYQVYKIDLDSNRKLYINISKLGGPNLDLFLMTPANYANWINLVNGKDTDEIKVLSALKVESILEESYDLGSGTYYLILDNTDFGNVYPPMNLLDDYSDLSVEVFSN